MVDYSISDVFKVLICLKKNLYGIKFIKHAENRIKKRKINQEIIFNILLKNKPVGIQKTHNESSKFELIYEYTKSHDLYIIINIENNDEIKIISVIDKKISRRDHFHGTH
ncbi:hypothetical protein [Methanobrevibacter sp. DSM 116169]|uniref:hypothetical protein n=1 Tax=Methanobrevibacter sp. DSM 116169 TaxID=3242727 RepID=UPI0038FC1AE2